MRARGMGNLAAGEPFCSRAATPLFVSSRTWGGLPAAPSSLKAPADHSPAMDDLLLTFGYAALFVGFIVTMAGEDHRDR